MSGHVLFPCCGKCHDCAGVCGDRFREYMGQPLTEEKGAFDFDVRLVARATLPSGFITRVGPEDYDALIKDITRDYGDDQC